MHFSRTKCTIELATPFLVFSFPRDLVTKSSIAIINLSQFLVKYKYSDYHYNSPFCQRFQRSRSNQSCLPRSRQAYDEADAWPLARS